VRIVFRPFVTTANTASRCGTKTAQLGWRFVAGAVQRERNVQNGLGYVDRGGRGDRNLWKVLPGFVVVWVKLGDGLGCHGLFGQKSDLVAPLFQTSPVEEYHPAAPRVRWPSGRIHRAALLR